MIINSNLRGDNTDFALYCRILAYFCRNKLKQLKYKYNDSNQAKFFRCINRNS